MICDKRPLQWIFYFNSVVLDLVWGTPDQRSSLARCIVRKLKSNQSAALLLRQNAAFIYYVIIIISMYRTPQMASFSFEFYLIPPVQSNENEKNLIKL